MINAITMAATLRYVVGGLAYEAATRGDGRVTKAIGKLTGHGKSAYLKKKVLIANDFYSEDPGTCWWILIDKPATGNDIVLGEAKDIVLAFATGAIAANVGGGVRGVLEAYDLAGKAEATSRLGGKMSDAWRAGVWSAAQGTRQEFSIALSSYPLILGGAATFAMTPEKEMTVTFRAWGAKKDFLTMLSAVERKHGRFGKEGIRATRELALTGNHYTFTKEHRVVSV